jgi:hypothetical protein
LAVKSGIKRKGLPVPVIKGLSVKQPWAGLIALGQKTIETRTWKTDYRGPLLICASARRDERAWQANDPPICRVFAAALAIVELVDCRPMTQLDERQAMCERYPRANSLVLANVYRLPKPLPAKGALYLWDVDSVLVPEWSEVYLYLWENAR